MGQIYTVTAESPTSSCSRIPAVLIHGFAAGVAFWAANIDDMAKKRILHCFDLLGFGRSSRPVFAKDPALAELQFVQSIENWRKRMGINKMILVGHSFGAFLAASFALEYPERVRHLVLVDPWGFPEKPLEIQEIFHFIPFPNISLKYSFNFNKLQNYPVWIRIATRAMSFFYPLAALRWAGPYGISVVKTLRPDLSLRFQCADPNAIYEYFYQCNAQNPSGEIAFTNMSFSFGWAKRPMLKRIIDLPSEVPMTFIYGSKSWIDSSSGIEVQNERRNAYVDVQNLYERICFALKIINGAGHHVYVDQKELFNNVLSDLFDKIDANEDMFLEKNVEKKIDSKSNGQDLNPFT
ncbi:hydrolase, alpha/beta domain protein [Onchocerca flexuosa]|uniref:Hydrolase, alpha/beta domain protein n=1 Tax=Onchocerca flexuosa TaxID=387005 RepID=A0A238BKL5_9BILA|nr:hydrolase, alpha/beta domain protein [Onchocerca flexuosa]